METNECPLCGCACDDVRDLAGHLLAFHSESVIGPGKLYLYAGSDSWPSMSCWCGHWEGASDVAKLAERFTRHLEDRGGLEAHLLELVVNDYFEIPF